MTTSERRIPGERLLRRVLQRGTVRPAVGTPASFFERLGVDDPWAERGFVADTAEQFASDGLFSFLSAQPYYAALRARRSWRSRHARRRLLDRLDEASGRSTMDLGVWADRAASMGASIVRRSGIAWTSDAPFVAIAAPPTREDVVAELQELGWLPPEARPTQRLRRRAARTSRAVAPVLEQIEQATPPAARRALRRVVAQIADLPEAEQVVAVARIARSVRGPLARIARRSAEDARSDLDTRPLQVATERVAPRSERRKGLRPVLHASPSLTTLVHEPVVADAPPAPVRRVRAVEAPAPTAAARSPKEGRVVAAAVRDVRTQRAAGRAGPETTTVAPQRAILAQATAAPTARVARLARIATEPVAPSDYGMDVVRPSAGAASARRRRAARRPIERATLPPVEAPLAVSPVVDAPSRRRADAVADAADAAETPWVRPSEATVSVERAVRVRRSRAVVAAPSAFLDPDVREPDAITEGPIRRHERRSAMVPATVRAARRVAARADGPAAASAGAPSPSPVHVGPPQGRAPMAGVVRHIAAFEAPTRERRTRMDLAEGPRRRRVHLSASPTEYVHLEPEARREALLAAAVADRRVDRRAVVAERAAVAGRPAARSIARSGAAEPSRVSAEPSRADGPRVAADGPRVAADGPRVAVARAVGTSPTARAVARAEPPIARVDDRGRALLSETPTAYVRAADPEPVAASPVSRRRRRLAVVDTDAVLRPERAEVSPTEHLAARGRRGHVAVGAPDAAPGTARTPSVAERTAAGPEQRGRRAIRVRDVSGRVVRRGAVGTGAMVYASARLEGADAGRPDVVADARSPLARQARRTRRPVAYADASRDFRWLVPEDVDEGTPAPRTPRLRVTAAGAGPMRRDELRAVLREVSTVVRALEREAEARVVLPTTRRALAGRAGTVGDAADRLAIASARLRQVAGAHAVTGARGARVQGGDAAPLRRRPLARGPDGTLLEPEVAPVAAAEARTTWAGARTPSGRGVARVAGRADGPELVRRSRTVRRSDGRIVPRRSAVEGAAGAMEAAEVGPRARRTLARTLGGLSDDVAPSGRRVRVDGPSRRSRASAPAMEPLAEDPAWARRASEGTAAPERAWVDPQGQVVRPRAGGLFSALARASTPDDVVKVILERADGLRGIGKELPEPAVRLVERIVRIQDQVVAQGVVGQDELEPLSPRRAPASRVQGATRNSRSVWSGARTLPARRSDGAGASNMMKLADKLQKLIHLAEHERKLAEAQRYVRMAQEDGKVESGKETASGEAVDAPNLKALQREVFDAVVHEIDLVKQRRQEDFDVSVWW